MNAPTDTATLQEPLPAGAGAFRMKDSGNRGLTAERLRELLSYDPTTGFFTWLHDRRKNLKGKRAGKADSHGHIAIVVDGVQYRAHRLAWLYVHGEFPQHDLDHINTARADNRIDNLREAPGGINQQNQRAATKSNRLGVLGVRAARNRYRAAIKINGRTVHLGTHDTPGQAHAAYVEAKRRLHEGNTL